MSTPHSRRWHRDSLFGAGPRRPLDREQRARFRFLLNAHRRARRITTLAEMVGNALVRRLGVNGQLDPAHATIAEDVGCCARTVRRALAAMKALGLLLWQRRIVREGWRTAQTSNAYLLSLPENPPEIRPRSTDGQSGPGTIRKEIEPVQQATMAEIADAQAALARRRRAVELRLGGR